MSLDRSTHVLLCSLTENFSSSASPAKHLVHAALGTWNLWFTAAPYPAERKYLDCSHALQWQSRADGGMWGSAVVPMAAAHDQGKSSAEGCPVVFVDNPPTWANLGEACGQSPTNSHYRIFN